MTDPQRPETPARSALHALTYELERNVWERRQIAFRRYYHADHLLEGYEKGAAWGTLATLDNILSEFRLRLDGYGGSGHEQMKHQRARCEASR